MKHQIEIPPPKPATMTADDDVTSIRPTPAQPSCSTCSDTGTTARCTSEQHGRYVVTTLAGGPCPDCIRGLSRMMEVPMWCEAHEEGWWK